MLAIFSTSSIVTNAVRAPKLGGMARNLRHEATVVLHVQEEENKGEPGITKAGATRVHVHRVCVTKYEQGRIQV